MDGARSSSILLVMAIVVGTMPAGWSYDFDVGGQSGWVPNPPVSFNQWAQMNKFQINDKLVFKYKNGEDSVLLVRREDYESCNVSTPIKKLSGGESTAFRLERYGVFFFISGLPGGCQQGQKLIVVVISPRSRQRIAPASSLAPSPSVAALPVSGSPLKGSRLSPAPAPSSDPEGSAVSEAASVLSALGVSVVLAALVLGGAFLA